MKALLLALLLLASSCVAPESGPAVSADRCFGLRGTWGAAPNSISFGDDCQNGGCYQYCAATATRCNARFYIRAKNADGSFDVTSYLASGQVGTQPYPDCPAVALAERNLTCRFDVFGTQLTLNCGGAGSDFDYEGHRL